MAKRHGALLLIPVIGGLAFASLNPWSASSEAVAEEEAARIERLLAGPPKPPPEPILAPFLGTVPAEADRARALAELRRGLEAQRANQPTAAVAAFERAAEIHPGIADWAHALAADALARAGEVAAVRRHLRAADEWLARHWGWRAEVRALRADGDLDAAIERAETAARQRDSDPGKAAAWVVAGEVYLLKADTVAARRAFRKAMEVAPGATAAIDAARALSALRNPWPEDLLEVGRIYLRHGNIERALAGLDAYAANPRGSYAERSRARLEAGRGLFNAGRYADAERRLLAVANDSLAPPAVAAEALFFAGRSQYRAGRRTQGMETFRRTAQRFPGEEATADALFTLADLEHHEGNLAVARDYYRQAVAIEAAHSNAALAGVRLGGLAFLEGDYGSALGVFDSLTRRYGGLHLQQAAFWSAKSQLRLGLEAEAHGRLREVWEADPLSWYGFRAAELLGGPPGPVPLAISPHDEPGLEAEVAAALERLDMLNELGLTTQAALEHERLRAHFSAREGGLYALAEAFNERGETHAGILLGREIHRREGAWNVRLLRIVYPFPYRDLVMEHARRNGLDPFLVAGLIRQESMWDPAIGSPVGATGLMQIMPVTGRGLARRAGVGGYQQSWLRRPDVNLRLGTLYMAELMQRYGGNVVDVLVAYNAGPSRLARWRQYPEHEYPELFAERIPFAETRNYVRVVQQNARLYAALYGDAGFELGPGQ